ncbi:MAG: DUF5131 family protein [Fibrobacteria bacterium]|nr:DUF5131 family protein [Fibrobacteria bacterium]
MWLGVSVENNTFLKRIKPLKKSEANVKFLSLEPLLGRVANLDTHGIDWVITGGESGPGARPIEYSWVAEIQKICKQTKTPFFFKQWGKKEFNINKNDPTIDAKSLQHAKGGCQLDGVVYKEMPRQMVLA